jgi:GDPmannose 4,6-dehydratase
LGVDIVWTGQGVDEKGIDSVSGKTIVQIDKRYFRPSEVDILIGDYSKAKRMLGWEPKVFMPELVKIMVNADLQRIKAEHGMEQ